MHEIAKRSNVSVTMVTYLERTGVFSSSYPSTSQKGSWRKYTFRDILSLRVISQLLAAGMQVSKLKDALIYFSQAHPEITLGGPVSKYLISDGKKVYFREDTSVLETLGSGQLAFAFVMEFSSLRDDTVANLSKDEAMIETRFRARKA